MAGAEPRVKARRREPVRNWIRLSSCARCQGVRRRGCQVAAAPVDGGVLLGAGLAGGEAAVQEVEGELLAQRVARRG
ncbi:hypothetical protein GCM10010417_48730 [Streptomyces carpaticus]